MVIGNAGGGKTTLCAVLSATHQLPYHSIDTLQWQPGWQQTPIALFNETHDKLIKQNRWLLDGYGPWESVLKRMNAADTIIVIDHPIWLHFWWATLRQLKSLVIKQTDVPLGCSRWPVTWKLYKMIWRLHKTQRAKLLKEATMRSSEKRFIYLSSPSELDRFTANPQ